MAKRIGDKHQVILEAAIKTFAQTGYHRTRVADIAREAGVADGTVYLYYKNKEDILITLFQTIMSKFVSDLNEELQQNHDANEKLLTIIRYHLKALSSKPDQARVTQIELRQIDQSINQGISKPLMSYFKVIEEVIEEGKKQNLYRQEINTRTARKVIFGAIDEVVTCWVMSSKRYDLNTLSEQIFNLLVTGLQ